MIEPLICDSAFKETTSLEKMGKSASGWICDECNSRYAAVVINPPKNEMIFEISNKCGQSIGYVCYECTSIPKKEFLGQKRALSQKCSNYGPMLNPYDLFIEQNGNIKVIVADGVPLASSSGIYVPIRQAHAEISAVLAKTKKNKKKRKTMKFEVVAKHYRKKCESNCPLCSGEVVFDSKVHSLLERCASVKDDIIYSVEQIPPPEVVTEETRAYFPERYIETTLSICEDTQMS